MRKESKRDVFQAIMLDYGVELEREYKFHGTRKWRFDYANVKNKLAIEVEGGVWKYGRHNRASGFVGDLEKYNAAAELGWRILRYTPQELMKMNSVMQIVATITNILSDKK